MEICEGGYVWKIFLKLKEFLLVTQNFISLSIEGGFKYRHGGIEW
jgi:hypothetical protein